METLRATTVITPDALLTPGEVSVDGGVIVDVRPTTGVAPDRVLCPGFVDVQVNGHDDVHCSTAVGDAWERMDALLVAQGVTAWCPTLVTAPLDSFADPLKRITEAAARPATATRPAILGAHLEGPFLGDAHGAHNPDWVSDLDLDWIAALPEIVCLMTLGPELRGATEAIELLVVRGALVSLGHSTATYEQTIAGADAGARLVTHLFNGMAPLHHRNPGILGAALADDRLTPSLIADGVHVHPAALRAAARAKGRGNWILVTDAVGWRDPGTVGGRVSIVDGAPRLANGTIAGSCLTMDAAVARMVHEAGIDLVDVVQAASTTPARLLGRRDERGAISAGLRADLVALDPSTLRATEVWIAT
ncbi:MAG: N-acetylglucosamine-6-phosphate deacetylase [Acidimicrobiales bacterium]|nr:N-acetylglucosamine-6-phosphate deacetylase [Acidimicrobiales bacterium]